MTDFHEIFYEYCDTKSFQLFISYNEQQVRLANLWGGRKKPPSTAGSELMKDNRLLEAEDESKTFPPKAGNHSSDDATSHSRGIQVSETPLW